jgi:hypothetical protein
MYTQTAELAGGSADHLRCQIGLNSIIPKGLERIFELDLFSEWPPRHPASSDEVTVGATDKSVRQHGLK